MTNIRLANGWRVPAANLWTEELVDEPLTFDWHQDVEDVRLSYLFPRDDDWAYDVLWPRTLPGHPGTHSWKAVNPRRQRDEMDNICCMVCDGPARIADTDRFPLLFTQDPGLNDEGLPVTNIPPTCLECIPESLDTCPLLKKRSIICSAAKLTPYAVEVDLFRPNELANAELIKRGPIVPLTAKDVLRHCLAKALLVTVHDMREENLRDLLPNPT